jgi:NAD+ synthase (glutamine-hydrolysing)
VCDGAAQFGGRRRRWQHVAIVAAANEARDALHADVVLLPELAVSGYPPEDLLFHAGMRTQVARSLERLKNEVHGITLSRDIPSTTARGSSIRPS